MWYRKIFTCIALTVSLFSAACVHAAEPKKEAEKFVVGMTSGYAPYVSLNAKGEYEGFDIDVANLIAQKINRKLVLQDLGTMPSLIMALKTKKINSIIWAVSITEARKKEMDMIYYQGEKTTEIPFIFWKEVPKEVVKIDDMVKLAKGSIGVEAGSYQDAVLQQYPDLKVKFLDKITDGIMEVKYGKSFATVVDYSLLPRIQEQYPEIKVLHLPLPPSQQSLGYGICINKDDQKLSQEVNKAVEELRAEGKLAELEQKWNLAKS